MPNKMIPGKLNMANPLSLVSYNCTVFGPGKPEYVAGLLDQYDMVLLQEHWLQESQFHGIQNVPCKGNVGVTSYDVSAIDPGDIITGRGYGGCSFYGKTPLSVNPPPGLIPDRVTPKT